MFVSKGGEAHEIQITQRVVRLQLHLRIYTGVEADRRTNNCENERLASCQTGRLGARFISQKEHHKEETT